jgi:nucleoside-diphosphate-sugar epimerase
MNFLITGGAGFIGSHTADAALAAGHRVRVLDDLSSGDCANLCKVESNSSKGTSPTQRP